MHACRIITTHNKDERHSLLEKYTSHFIERVVCEREFKTEQNCNILTPTLLVIIAFLSRSPGLLNRGTGVQPLWVLVFSTASSLQLVWSPNSSIGDPGCCFLYSFIFQLCDHQNSLNFLCTKLHNISTSTQSLTITGHRNMHFRRLGIACLIVIERKSVMQFTGHSLPVHQSVTVPWDFNPVPYCQPSSPTPTEYRTSTVFGMICLAGSEVNILHLHTGASHWI